MQKYYLPVAHIVKEAEGIYTFYFEKRDGINWEEGAHTHIAYLAYDTPVIPDKSLVRHMSIMTLPTEQYLGITTRIPQPSSLFKQELLKLNRGDSMIFFKLGSRLKLRRQNNDAILLSMGVGVATMRPLIKSYHEDNTGIHHMVHINVDRSGAYLFKDDLESAMKDSLELVWTLSRQQYFDILSQHIKQATDYYLVGSDDFLISNIQFLMDRGIARDHIVIDKKEEVQDDYFLPSSLEVS